MISKSDKDETNLRRFDNWTLPVVQVVLQIAVASSEIQSWEDGAILHDIQGVKDI